MYSTILFLTLRSSPFNFKQKSQAFSKQLSPSKAIMSFLRLANSSRVCSRPYLQEILLKR